MRKRIRLFLGKIADSIAKEIDEVEYDICIEGCLTSELELKKRFLICKLSLVESILNWI